MPVNTRTSLMLASLVLAVSACDDRGEAVSAADIAVVSGPDGEVLFQPTDSAVATSTYAQWLQLRVDLEAIATTGDFLDTQIANLHQQEALLRRGQASHWTWQRLHGSGNVDFKAALSLVDKRLAALNQAS